MKVVQCRNKHFYDSDMYPKCPHCGEMPLGAESNPGAEKKETSKSGWNPFKKRTKTESSASFAPQVSETEAPAPKMEIVDVPMQNDVTVSYSPENQEEDGVTVSYSPESNGEDDRTMVFSSDPVKSDNESRKTQDIEPVEAVEKQEMTQEMPAPVKDEPKQPQQGEKISLREAVSMASADSEGRTMSYFSMLSSNASQNTKPESKKAVQNEPTVANPAKEPEPVNEPAAVQQRVVDFPVGWLVCISGQHLGNTFMLSAGKNSIGRLSNNQIALVKDPSVSREKHASVVYEPKKRVFYLQPGDSSGLTYLNDEYIDSSRMIQAYDVIEIGETKLMLMPLCSEKFTWDEYIK